MPIDFGPLHAAVTSAAAFGEPAFYTPVDPPPLPEPIMGVFDRFQVEVIDGNGAPVSVPRTTFGCRQADFPPGFQHRSRDRLQVRGVTYDVTDAQPDGQGWVTLVLGRIG